MLAGLLLSPKLWLSARHYPLTPVLPIFQPIPPPFDLAVFIAMILLLALIAVLPRPTWLLAAFLVLAFALALADQTRWQPWFYQYLFMLLAIGFSKPDPAIQICRLIVASIYFWSGVQKINPGFVDDTFPWLVGSRSFTWLAFAVPLVESGIGLGLLTRRFRNTAVIAALAMHAFILASIGPFGHDHNRVVWPWNIAMGTLVVLLFWRKDFEARSVFFGRRLHVLVLALFALMPALSIVDLWDSYPSFSLYSGNQRKATFYMTDAVAGRLPEPVQDVMETYDSEFQVDTLDIEDWCFDELHVPDYAEPRVLENIGQQVCRDAGNSPLIVMIVEGRRRWYQQRHMTTYTCDGLWRTRMLQR